jgi:hypothetical protein
MNANLPPYIVCVTGTPPVVEAWSRCRLPFEPRGWLRDLRADLRAAAALLVADKGSVLRAVYATADPTACDVENVLLYNVGPGSFARAATQGVRLERTDVVPASTTPVAAGLHYHRYELEERGSGFRHWQQEAELASWPAVQVPPLTSTIGPTRLWWAIRTSDQVSVRLPATTPAHLGPNIRLTVPAGAPFNLASALKPLLDAVVCAFHAHTGDSGTEPGARVGQALGVEAAIVDDLVRREERAVLGTRRLLWPWRDGVQWNPADDCCAAIEVLVDTHAAGSWLCSGRLYTLQPALPSARPAGRGVGGAGRRDEPRDVASPAGEVSRHGALESSGEATSFTAAWRYGR